MTPVTFLRTGWLSRLYLFKLPDGAKELEAMAYLCRQLGMPAAGRFTNGTDTRWWAVRTHCYDDRDGFFTVLTLTFGLWIFQKSPFLP